MKIVMGVFIALSVVAGLVVPAGAAWNPDEFWTEQQQRLP
jgi:hypothetical protein